MITIAILVKRKAGMSREAFRDHYENNHVPLALKHIGHLFLEYRRHYVDIAAGHHDDAVMSSSLTGSREGGYDAVTTITVADQAAIDEMERIENSPGVKEEIQADEKKFIDREALRFFICGSTISTDVPTKKKL